MIQSILSYYTIFIIMKENIIAFTVTLNKMATYMRNVFLVSSGISTRCLRRLMGFRMCQTSQCRHMSTSESDEPSKFGKSFESFNCFHDKLITNKLIIINSSHWGGVKIRHPCHAMPTINQSYLGLGFILMRMHCRQSLN